jgi:hypothetical protein
MARQFVNVKLDFDRSVGTTDIERNTTYNVAT